MVGLRTGFFDLTMGSDSTVTGDLKASLAAVRDSGVCFETLFLKGVFIGC